MLNVETFVMYKLFPLTPYFNLSKLTHVPIIVNSTILPITLSSNSSDYIDNSGSRANSLLKRSDSLSEKRKATPATLDAKMHTDIYSARRGRRRDSVTRVCFRTYVRSRDAPDDPFRSGPRAFTIIHVNCPQHARSCPKSHAPWLDFAAGQTFRTVSESVLRRISARGPNGALSSLHGNVIPLCIREICFFLHHAFRWILSDLRESNSVKSVCTVLLRFTSVECNMINNNEAR